MAGFASEIFFGQGGDPKKNCQKIWIYCIQNDRTEHTK